MKRRYRTQGVAPPENEGEYYDEEKQCTMRDNGAVWDSDKREWKRTLWKSIPQKYKVTYDDGSYEILNEKPENPPEGKEIVSVEEIPACWELYNEYVSAAEKPEWDEYKTREAYFVEEQPIQVTVPLSRQGGPDNLIRYAKRNPRNSKVGILR